MSYTSFRDFCPQRPRGVNWTPGWLPPKGEILPCSEWINALDDFKTRELAKVGAALEMPVELADFCLQLVGCFRTPGCEVVEMEVSKVFIPKAVF